MEHVQLVESLYKALAAGDADTATELLHPDFVGRTTEGLPLDLGGVFSGPGEMLREFWWRIGRHYRAKAVPRQFLPTEDGRLLVVGVYEGEARESGGSLDAVFAHLIAFRDGRIGELTQITDSARWSQALGPGTEGLQRRLTRVRFEVTDGLAHIRLARPERRNAIDQAMIADLYEVSRRCAETEGVRAVLITAEGPAFNVGVELDVFAGVTDEERPVVLRGMVVEYHDALRRLLSLEVPVVSAVHGAVAGGGLGLVYCADFVLAAEGTKFAVAFGAIGASSDSGASWFLPRLVGMRRAAELYFESRVLTAAEAAEWGLISRVVPAADLEAEATTLARRLAAGPTRAYGEMRRLFRDGWDRDVLSHFEAEEAAVIRSFTTADSAEGIRAFIAKRPAEFKGR